MKKVFFYLNRGLGTNGFFRCTVKTQTGRMLRLAGVFAGRTCNFTLALLGTGTIITYKTTDRERLSAQVECVSFYERGSGHLLLDE